MTITDAHACTATDVSSITVNPIPTVNAGIDFSLCNTPIPYILSGYSPIGGTWSGSGVSPAGVFTPGGIGKFTLTYSATQNGCVGTDQTIVSVVSPVIPIAGVDQSFCLGSAPIL